MLGKIIKSPVFLGLVLLVVGFAIGKYATPAKIVTETEIKTVEVIKEVKVSDNTKSKQNNTQKHIIETTYPDGRKVKETFIIDKDTIFVTKKESTNKESSKETSDKSKKIVENQKSQWAIGVTANTSSNLLSGPNYGVIISRRIFGPFSIGAQGDLTGDSKRYGVFVQMEF